MRPTQLVATHLSLHRRSWIRRQFLSAFVITATLSPFAIDPLRATEPNDRNGRAVVKELTDEERQVQEAVDAARIAEAQGDLTERARQLKLAALLDADYAPLNWARGLVESSSGEWTSVDEAVQSASDDEKLKSYEARRLMAADSAQGQWNMVVWCVQQKMQPQARAHARRVLDFETDHAGARKVLGYQRVGEEWLSSSQVKKFTERAAAARTGFDKYARSLRDIARDLKNTKPEVRSKAEQRLQEIDDESAIAPVEALLGGSHEAAARAAVDWLGRIASEETSVALVRMALVTPHSKVRTACVEQLKERPLHDYVPGLLQTLSSPVATMWMPALDASGNFIGYRQIFQQEQQNKTNIVVIDTGVNYTSRGVGRSNPSDLVFATAPTEAGANLGQGIDMRSQIEAVNRADQQAIERTARVAANNGAIEMRNMRVASLLSVVSGEEIASDAKEIWKWWDRYNETEHQAAKFERVRYTSAMVSAPNYATATPRPNWVGECFTEGTPVMTRRGLKAIDKVQVGDLVLSRDLGTGSLQWKPVLQATRRQPRAIREISVGGETFQSTGGHLFWVSGQGWKKASEVQVGDVLHCAAEPMVVTVVKDSADQMTFNLEVDESHTYFVGKNLILSHDVTDRQHTRIPVPGLLKTVPVE
ncbi:MAG: polymorphic toxin-type HINT domain-containing protein [Pirellulales bacterium]